MYNQSKGEAILQWIEVHCATFNAAPLLKPLGNARNQRDLDAIERANKADQIFRMRIRSELYIESPSLVGVSLSLSLDFGATSSLVDCVSPLLLLLLLLLHSALKPKFQVRSTQGSCDVR